MGLLKALLRLIEHTDEERAAERIARWTCQAGTPGQFITLISYAHTKPEKLETHTTGIGGIEKVLPVVSDWKEAGYYDKVRNVIVADDFREYELIDNRTAPGS